MKTQGFFYRYGLKAFMDARYVFEAVMVIEDVENLIAEELED